MKIVVAKEFAEMRDYISQLPQRTDNFEGYVIYNKRNRVVRFSYRGLNFMVKRFKRANLIQQIAYSFFQKSKAERAFLFSDEFLRRGISTPKRVAYMERKRMGLFSVGYFVSLEAEGTETHLLLREVEHYDAALAEAVARQIVDMHSKGILHGDLNLSNFVCKEDDNGFYFTMIDINRSKFCSGYPSDKECLKNLVRLTHRRDLYKDLIGRYALIRGWNVEETVNKGVALLDRFENRKIRL